MTKSPLTGRTVAAVAVVVLVIGGGLYACKLSPTCPLASLVPVFDRQDLRNTESNFHTDLRGENSMSPTSSHAQVTGKVEHASTADFEQKVLQSDVPVLVDFYADWCGPCKMLAPMLDELAQETSDARIVKVNVDDSPELAMQYGVSAIPSLAVFKGGQIVAEHVGMANKGQLQAMLRQ